MSRTVKNAIILLTAAAIVGCAAPKPPDQNSATKAAIPTITPERSVRYHMKSTLPDRRYAPDGKIYALIEQVGNSWDVVRYSKLYPYPQGRQEVFLITEDFKTWDTTIESEATCTKDRTDYSVCISSLAQRDTRGTTLGGEAFAAVLSAGLTLVAGGRNMHYNAEAVQSAINSIPGSAKDRLDELMGRAKAVQRVEEQQRAARKDECWRNATALEKEYQAAAVPARAKQAAGYMLTPIELAAVRKAQVFSVSSECSAY